MTDETTTPLGVGSSSDALAILAQAQSEIFEIKGLLKILDVKHVDVRCEKHNTNVPCQPCLTLDETKAYLTHVRKANGARSYSRYGTTQHPQGWHKEVRVLERSILATPVRKKNRICGCCAGRKIAFLEVSTHHAW